MTDPIKFTNGELVSAPARFVHSRSARFQDVDAAGIVFYPRILEYFHDAYCELLEAEGCSLVQVLASRAWAAPIKHVEARFLRPVRFGDRLEVGIVAARFDGGDLGVGYRIESQPGKVAVAVGQSTHAFVDATSFKRIDPPDALRQVFRRFETAAATSG